MSACATVLLVHGLGGMFVGEVMGMSAMNDLERALRNEPRVHVETFVHDADEAMVTYARKWAWECPIVLAGHSAGANAVVRVAHRLLPEAIPVALLIAFDPPDRPVMPLMPLPANVEVAALYRQDGFLGGGSLHRARGNTLTAYLRNTTVRIDHISMPRHFVPDILRDVRRLAGVRRKMP